jgi:hypothetical protein
MPLAFVLFKVRLDPAKHRPEPGGRQSRQVFAPLVVVRKNASVIIPSLRCAATGAPFSSAIEIASGRLFAGRPPAWTLPRRPHRRSPGAKRPLRRGFNRMPEQLPWQQPTQITRNLNLIDAKPHADEFLCQMQPQIRDAATTLMRRGAAKGRPAPPARFWPGRSCRWRSYSSKSASILLNIDQNRGAVNPVRYLPHLSWCARTLRLSSLPSVAQRLERLSVQRLKSPLEGFSPGVHLRGRCHGDRTGGRPARSVLSGAVYGD